MKKIFAPIVSFASIVLISCAPKYNVEESNKLVNSINSDSVKTQKTYSQMIDMLDKGYAYMQGRLAGAAFERNPSEAINDIINMVNDSTLNAVQQHSGIMIATLDTANLNKENAKKFKNVRAKYRELEESLLPDSTASVSH